MFESALQQGHFVLIKIDFVMCWDKENVETERIVKGGSEASLEKRNFLDLCGFTNRKYFTYVSIALVYVRTHGNQESAPGRSCSRGAS